MTPLYTNDDFRSTKSRQLLPLKCLHCGKTFMRTKHDIQAALNPKQNNTYDFCTPKCGNIYKRIGHVVFTPCTQCGKKSIKELSDINRSKNHFCSRSCSAKWNNAHKTHGTRRSKLEVWLEEQLHSLYPDIKFDFNKTDTIDAELDIFMPSLKLAFEMNGIFHYEPIFGDKKLASMQTNDNRKILACAEKGIGLCVIDTSLMRNFKTDKAQKYLDIIINIINQTSKNVP